MVINRRKILFDSGLRNVAACLLAMLAMFASAVSACACSHHQPAVADVEQTSSCHPASHSETSTSTAASTEPPASDTVGEGCSCFVSSRTPAITAKSENKHISAEAVSASIIRLDFPASVTITVKLAKVTPNADVYVGVPPRSGPSRAPPRA